MSVRRTVAQSSAGLMLLAALAFGPAVAFGEVPATPGGPSDGGGEQPTACEEDAIPKVTVSPVMPTTGDQVTFIGECFPVNRGASVAVINDTTQPVSELTSIGKDGSFSYSFEVTSEGSHRYQIEVDGQQIADGSFDVAEAPTSEPPDDEAEEDPGSTTPPPDEDGADDGDQGDDGQDSGGDEGDAGDDSGADDGQDPDAGNGNGSDDSENGDDQGQDQGDQGNDGSSGGDSQNEDSSEDGDTSASAGDDSAASQDPAPQPPAAPGSATNDFPSVTPEPTADQKQSAALAALMTSLFANGVSSGEVGTTPDEARTVIDPSADASEIAVPADGASDAGGASEDGAGSGASDDDALAATGSNLLVPAGIAGLAILAGAGLKIHQLRRDR